MKLVPYTYSSQRRTEKVIHTVRVLMEGTQIWTEPEISTDPLELALRPNGITAQVAGQEGDLHYFKVDTKQTDLESMYDYRECEANTDMLCWNTFHIVTDLKGNPWIDIPNQQSFLRTILKAHYVE
jgi:hypothetical protein